MWYSKFFFPLRNIIFLIDLLVSDTCFLFLIFCRLIFALIQFFLNISEISIIQNPFLWMAQFLSLNVNVLCFIVNKMSVSPNSSYRKQLQSRQIQEAKVLLIHSAQCVSLVFSSGEQPVCAVPVCSAGARRLYCDHCLMPSVHSGPQRERVNGQEVRLWNKERLGHNRGRERRELTYKSWGKEVVGFTQSRGHKFKNIRV